ncbi:hypothetical protein HMPREF3293_00173 [Christensenella minuta]|uniref:Uncharacterized protein n=1 Tax=Christensenella minuta TaxID=626937 RepID=A0A136Q8F9_9FIRM|nr:hypothetical protein HMPREF3293_00173 [Christensenella minuta]
MMCCIVDGHQYACCFSSAIFSCLTESIILNKLIILLFPFRLW